MPVICRVVLAALERTVGCDFYVYMHLCQGCYLHNWIIQKRLFLFCTEAWFCYKVCMMSYMIWYIDKFMLFCWWSYLLNLQTYSGASRSVNSMTSGASSTHSPSQSSIGDQLSKTNLYIRGLQPNTSDRDLVNLCQGLVWQLAVVLPIHFALHSFTVDRHVDDVYEWWPLSYAWKVQRPRTKCANIHSLKNSCQDSVLSVWMTDFQFTSALYSLKSYISQHRIKMIIVIIIWSLLPQIGM